MSRFTHLLVALGLAGLTAGATVIACGHPGLPSEAPPLAPRPDVTPAAMPVPLTAPAPAPVVAPVPSIDGRRMPAFGQAALDLRDRDRGAPRSLSMRAAVAPDDAGASDPLPLPPVPDAAILVDGRALPSLGN